MRVDDANDNAPVFNASRYQFRVDLDKTSAGQVIGQVTAQDADLTQQNSLVRYLLEPQARTIFAINADTGEISLTDAAHSSGFNSFDFSVTAQDSGSPSLKVKFVDQLLLSHTRS